MKTTFEKQSELFAAGVPFVCVTLIDTTGSTPQDSGSKMIVTAAGLEHGTIGGGKAEHEAINIAKQMLAAPTPENRTRLIEWNLNRDLGMVCGGAVRIFFEAFNTSTWRIVIFGAGHVASAVIGLLANLECRVDVYDTRPEWIAKLPQSARIQTHCPPDLATMVDQLPDQAFVLCMTMGHVMDRPILRRILTTRKFPFVGAIGSKAKSASVRRWLEENGLTALQAANFTCPLGLPIGGNHPWEIAVSVVAQLLQVRDQQAAASDPAQSR